MASPPSHHSKALFPSEETAAAVGTGAPLLHPPTALSHPVIILSSDDEDDEPAREGTRTCSDSPPPVSSRWPLLTTEDERDGAMALGEGYGGASLAPPPNGANCPSSYFFSPITLLRHHPPAVLSRGASADLCACGGVVGSAQCAAAAAAAVLLGRERSASPLQVLVSPLPSFSSLSASKSAVGPRCAARPPLPPPPSLLERSSQQGNVEGTAGEGSSIALPALLPFSSGSLRAHQPQTDATASVPLRQQTAGVTPSALGGNGHSAACASGDVCSVSLPPRMHHHHAPRPSASFRIAGAIHRSLSALKATEEHVLIPAGALVRARRRMEEGDEWASGDCSGGEYGASVVASPTGGVGGSDGAASVFPRGSKTPPPIPSTSTTAATVAASGDVCGGSGDLGTFHLFDESSIDSTAADDRWSGRKSTVPARHGGGALRGRAADAAHNTDTNVSAEVDAGGAHPATRPHSHRSAPTVVGGAAAKEEEEESLCGAPQAMPKGAASSAAGRNGRGGGAVKSKRPREEVSCGDGEEEASVVVADDSLVGSSIAARAAERRRLQAEVEADTEAERKRALQRRRRRARERM